MDTIKPIFSNYREFYELYFKISENYIFENEMSIIDENNKLGFLGESLVKIFKDRISTIFSERIVTDELVFDYVPIDFYIPYLDIFSFCNNLKFFIKQTFNSYFKLLHHSYLLNQDRLLHYHIDNLISSTQETILFLKNIDIDADYFFDYENENFLLQHYSDDSIAKYKTDLKLLNELLEKKISLHEKVILQNESKILSYYEISNLLGRSTLLGIIKKADTFKNVDYNIKVFCSSILYFLEYYQRELFENLLLKIDEVSLKDLIKEKVSLSDLPPNNLSKCFFNYETYDNFYQHYVSVKETNFSEFSMAYHSLKKSNLLLPVREDFFLNELMKYRSDINSGKKKQSRFYRNTTLFSRNYEVKFNRIFKLKKES